MLYKSILDVYKTARIPLFRLSIQEWLGQSRINLWPAYQHSFSYSIFLCLDGYLKSMQGLAISLLLNTGSLALLRHTYGVSAAFSCNH